MELVYPSSAQREDSRVKEHSQVLVSVGMASATASLCTVQVYLATKP